MQECDVAMDVVDLSNLQDWNTGAEGSSTDVIVVNSQTGQKVSA
jgi:hypothetical protein